MLAILKHAGLTYTTKRGARMAAAFTFYAMLSLAPALVLGIVMATAFGLGRHFIALYFQYSNFSAAYGAAGAIVVVLLWIYFSSQMYFFCVALSRSWAETRGSLASQKERAPDQIRGPSLP